MLNIDTYASTLYITEESLSELNINAAMSKIGDAALSLIEFIIKKFKDLGKFIVTIIGGLIDKIKKWFAAKDIYTKKNQIMIAKQIREIDIQLKETNRQLKEFDDDINNIETSEKKYELETKYESLANQRVQLVEKYKFLSSNYIISDSHYNDYLRGMKDCDTAIKEIKEYFNDFSTKIGKYDYIPLMQNNAAASVDMRSVVNMYSDQPLTTRIGAQVGASATIAAKRAANAYHKVYNESDSDYLNYVDIIETYNDSGWFNRINEYKTRIEETLSGIRERFKTETVAGSVKLFPHTKVDEIRKSINDLETIKSIMQKATKRYEYILDTNYKLPGEHFKRKKSGLPFQFISQKAPKYLVDIVNIFTRFASEFSIFINLKNELINTISTPM